MAHDEAYHAPLVWFQTFSYSSTHDKNARSESGDLAGTLHFSLHTFELPTGQPNWTFRSCEASPMNHDIKPLGKRCAKTPEILTDWVPIRAIPMTPRVARSAANRFGLDLKKVGRELFLDRIALNQAIQASPTVAP